MNITPGSNAAALLQRLVDLEDINALLIRYCEALDSKNWTLLDEVFLKSAICDYGQAGNPTGLEEIKQTIIHVIGQVEITQHFLANPSITIAGNSATANSYLLAQHIDPGRETDGWYLLGGTYTDELVRCKEGWRIRYRQIHRRWHLGNSQVTIQLND